MRRAVRVVAEPGRQYACRRQWRQWIQGRLGVNFSAALVSKSGDVAADSIKFASPQSASRAADGAGTVNWTSSAATNSVIERQRGSHPNRSTRRRQRGIFGATAFPMTA